MLLMGWFEMSKYVRSGGYRCLKCWRLSNFTIRSFNNYLKNNQVACTNCGDPFSEETTQEMEDKLNGKKVVVEL